MSMVYTESDIIEEFAFHFNSLSLYEKCVYEMRMNGYTFVKIAKHYSQPVHRIYDIYNKAKTKLHELMFPTPIKPMPARVAEDIRPYTFDYKKFIHDLEAYREKVRSEQKRHRAPQRTKRYYSVSNNKQDKYSLNISVSMQRNGEIQDWIRLKVLSGANFHELKIWLRKNKGIIVTGTI